SQASSSAPASWHRHVTTYRLPSRHGGGASGVGPAGADRGARPRGGRRALGSRGAARTRARGDRVGRARTGPTGDRGSGNTRRGASGVAGRREPDVRLLAFATALGAGLVFFSAAAAAAPTPVTAWYMYGSSPNDLKSYAYAHGCGFAKAQPNTSVRMLLLDFGAARKLDSSTWVAAAFSNTTFSNADILAALKRAADGYHNCHLRGGVDIVYGNSNYHLSASGMSTTDAWYAGFHQAERVEDLADYQVSKGYD